MLVRYARMATTMEVAVAIAASRGVQGDESCTETLARAFCAMTAGDGAHEVAETLIQPGAVAKAVGNRGQGLRRDDGTASGGEVNHALGGRLTQGLPAIDLAHADLA